MKLKWQYIPKLFLLTAGVGIWLVATTQVVMAQSANAADLGGGSDRSTTGLDNGEGLSMFDLMHRLQQGAVRSQSEFIQEQQQNIGSEAANFRNRQRLEIEQTPGSGTGQSAPASNPQSDSQL